MSLSPLIRHHRSINFHGVIRTLIRTTRATRRTQISRSKQSTTGQLPLLSTNRWWRPTWSIARNASTSQSLHCCIPTSSLLDPIAATRSDGTLAHRCQRQLFQAILWYLLKRSGKAQLRSSSSRAYIRSTQLAFLRLLVRISAREKTLHLDKRQAPNLDKSSSISDSTKESLSPCLHF